MVPWRDRQQSTSWSQVMSVDLTRPILCICGCAALLEAMC